MSYREENGQVVLTMSDEDFCALLLRLGIAAAQAAKTDPELFIEHVKMLDRLNEGNPNYTPYQVEKK